MTRIAARIFRLARIARIETGVLIWELHGDDAEIGGNEPDGDRWRNGLLFGLGHQTRDAETTQQRVRDAEIARSSDLARLGRAFIRDASAADALSKLSRYESRLERALLRDLGELERIQRSRDGGDQLPNGRGNPQGTV